jgi:predicted dehydrogenase
MLGDVTYQFGDDAELVLPAGEVLQRFVALHPEVPTGLRDLYGVSYLVQDLAFVEALLAGRTPAPDIAVGLAAQRLAAAAYHAARTGEEVNVETFVPAEHTPPLRPAAAERHGPLSARSQAWRG